MRWSGNGERKWRQRRVACSSIDKKYCPLYTPTSPKVGRLGTRVCSNARKGRVESEGAYWRRERREEERKDRSQPNPVQNIRC